jgi:hypothetical protein
MSQAFSRRSLENLKRHAKEIKRERGCSHSEALDQVAVRYGYQNWSLLSKSASAVPINETPSYLKVVPGYPISLLALGEEPRYEIITIDISKLYGCDLDCALAISLLTKGTLYINFLPDGRSFLVYYKNVDQNKEIYWSPTSNMALAMDILKTHIPSWTGGYLEGLRAIVSNNLGTSVDCLRLRRAS